MPPPAQLESMLRLILSSRDQPTLRAHNVSGVTIPRAAQNSNFQNIQVIICINGQGCCSYSAQGYLSVWVSLSSRWLAVRWATCLIGCSIDHQKSTQSISLVDMAFPVSEPKKWASWLLKDERIDHHISPAVKTKTLIIAITQQTFHIHQNITYLFASKS